MFFNSLEFFLFLPIVLFLYWIILVKNLRVQNLLITISSYIFYAWWDWRFLSLLILSTVVDYFIGLKIYGSDNKKYKKRFLYISIVFNIGLLCVFKYYNFFVESWVDLLNTFGYRQIGEWTLNIVLPVGISFYTFQTMSYSLDIYFKKIRPTRDFISFSAFVSFFPQLVAGPIERASNFLPQLLKYRTFQYIQFVNGLRLILWGMFKKVVIADSLAWRVNYSFENFQILDGGTLLLGLLYFSVQIYCDFSGYSDIAIGIAKLFGIEIMSNFKFPYFSRNIGEFWRRWHISLSSWFRDYLYIPLGGSKKGIFTTIKNILIIFIVSGLWHGANWTFIIWGFTHSLLFIPLLIRGKNRYYYNNIVADKKNVPSFKELYQIGMTFILVTISWVFFRSESLSDSLYYLYRIFYEFKWPVTNRSGLVFVLILFVIDWMWRKDERSPLNINIRSIRWIIYTIFLYLIIGNLEIVNMKQFIYFQF